MLKGLHEFTFLCIASRKNLPEVIDRTARHTGTGQFRDPVLAAALPQCLGHQCHERVTILKPVLVAAKACILRQLRQAATPYTGRKLTIVTDCDHDVPICGGKGLVRGDVRMRRSKTSRHLAADEIVHVLVGKPCDLAVEQRYLDRLAARGISPFGKRSQDRCCRVHAAHDICNRNAHFLWFAAIGVRRPGDTHQATRRLDHRVIARFVRTRATPGECRNRAVNQSRVTLPQTFGIESPTLHCSGFEVFDQDVRTTGKFPYQFLPVRMREVDRNRALVAIGGQKIGGFTLAIALEPGWTPCAGIVAAAGTLYLDDIRTVVAE